MKKAWSILLIGTLLFQSFRIHPTELSKEERKAAISYLQETSDYFTSKVNGLNDAQLDFKSKPESWSVRNCMEHIALSESFIFTVIENLIKQPANPEKRGELKFTDEQVKIATADRSKKGQAPEPLKPTEKYKNAADAVESFLKSRQANIEYIETTKDDLRNHLAAHPFFGMLDGYQWMLLLSAHTKRHTLQIEEIMASDNFPKN